MVGLVERVEEVLCVDDAPPCFVGQGDKGDGTGLRQEAVQDVVEQVVWKVLWVVASVG